MDQLVIKDQIRELMARYVRYADEKKWDDLASLFTLEGTFSPLNVAGQPLLVMKRRPQIAQTILDSVGQATAIHHLFSYEIDLESVTQASGVFSMEDYLIRSETTEAPASSQNALNDFKTMHGFGHYHGRFVLDDGNWHIESLVLTRIKIDFTY